MSGEFGNPPNPFSRMEFQNLPCQERILKCYGGWNYENSIGYLALFMCLEFKLKLRNKYGIHMHGTFLIQRSYKIHSSCGGKCDVGSTAW